MHGTKLKQSEKILEAKAAILVWELSHKVGASRQPFCLIQNQSQLFSYWSKWKIHWQRQYWLMRDGHLSAISALSTSMPCKRPLGHLTALATAIQIFTNTVMQLHWGIRADWWRRAFKYGRNTGQHWQIAGEGGAISFLVLGQMSAKSHHDSKGSFWGMQR